MSTSAPLNIAQLEGRLAETAADFGAPVARLRALLTTLVVSQMLPEAVTIKGGMGLKLRLGEQGTRATTDLDVSSPESHSRFSEAFAARLERGWGRVPASRGQLKRNPSAPERIAFTGSLREGRIHDPGLIHPQYLVRPFRVSLSFLGRPFSAIDVELAHPENGRDAHSRLHVDVQLQRLSDTFGFGALQPVWLVDLEHQIAQKIHAVADPAYRRAHDLVDLQLLMALEPDELKLREFCEQTFAFRRSPAWPPLPLRDMRGWEPAYRAAAEETRFRGHVAVLPSLEEARQWLSATIERLLPPRDTGLGSMVTLDETTQSQPTD